MSHLHLVPDPKPTDFPLEEGKSLGLSGGKFLLPRELMRFFSERNIVTAGAVVSYLRASPEGLWKIGWDPKQIRSFTAFVLWELRGKLPRSLLLKRSPPKRTYGALLVPRS